MEKSIVTPNCSTVESAWVDVYKRQLLSNGLGGVDVDALELTGIGGHLVRREGSVGGHGQLASLNGGQLSGCLLYTSRCV